MVQGIPPPHLQALIDSVAAGFGLRLYIPITVTSYYEPANWPQKPANETTASGLALKVISGLRL
jgi:hypothetical protein